MRLHDLRAPEGANVKRIRRGRGESSGLGKTAGLGGKGQTARTGKGKRGRGFEGGQVQILDMHTAHAGQVNSGWSSF